MKLSERTADTLRNVERSHWQTSYDLAHTGLGDANPMCLDNYNEKMEKFKTDGTEDDKLVRSFAIALEFFLVIM